MFNLTRFNLLYAEDEAETRKYYAKYLNHFFDEVFIAHNGEQARRLYYQHQPDVLIVDNFMPKLTGLDLAKEIRQVDSNIKIVLLTAANDQASLLKAIELNLVTYLIKPVKSQKLKEALYKLSVELNQNNQIYDWTYKGQNFRWDGIENTLTNVTIDGSHDSITLTKKEQRLFHLLISEQSKKASFNKVFRAVYFDEPHKDFSEYAIKALIKSLRNKLPEGAIKNSYGQGYYLQK